MIIKCVVYTARPYLCYGLCQKIEHILENMLLLEK